MIGRIPRFAACAALALLIAVSLVSPAAAQKQIKMKGKLKEVTNATTITITNTMDMEVTVRCRPETATVEGTADPAYLTPGVPVQFVADINNGGYIQGDLKEITICTITKQDQETFSLNDPTKPSNKGKDAINTYLVRGTIKTNRKGALMVNIAGKQPNMPPKVVRGQLADDAKIKVVVSDLKMAQPGDAVEFQGQERDGVYSARKLTITMAKPLEPAAAPGKKKTASK